jgi:hypothetical protein
MTTEVSSREPTVFICSSPSLAVAAIAPGTLLFVSSGSVTMVGYRPAKEAMEVRRVKQHFDLSLLSLIIRPKKEHGAIEGQVCWPKPASY